MDRLAGLCARSPWWTLALVVCVTAIAAWSAVNTESAAGTDANLGSDHPAVVEFEEFLGRFGGGYPILIAYECSSSAACGGALDRPALKMAHAVSRELAKAPFVTRVASPASTSLLIPTALGLESKTLVVGGEPSEDQDLYQRAMSDPLWSRTLVSTNGQVGAIVVELSSTDGAGLSSTITSVESALDPFIDAGFRFYVVGEAAISVAAQRAGRASAARAGVFTGGMLFLTLLFLIRSLPAVIASLGVVGVASAWTMGVIPAFGWQRSHLTSGAATLILVIGCANCVHFVSYYLENRPRFASVVEAIEATSRWVVAPCLLTTATTAGAFLSFGGGTVLALRQFGSMAAVGVVAAFFLTFSLFPALLVVLRPQPRRLQFSAAWQEVLGRLAGLGIRRRQLVLIVALALALLGIAGVPKLQVEMNVAELWGADHPVTQAIDFVSDHLQETDRLEIELALGQDHRIQSPDTLRIIADLEEAAEKLEGIGETRSLLTLLRRGSHLVYGTDPHSIPLSAMETGELIFLISSGSAGALDQWLTLDQTRTRLSLGIEKMPMHMKRALLREMEELITDQIPADWSYQLTGPLVLADEFGGEFSESQTNIVSASGLLVTGLIAAYLRSVPWALLAVLPNAAALVLLFGTMGHWGISMNFGSAVVAPIAIGIAADDTIHFLTAYARERRKGIEPTAALRNAISKVGEAVLATAAALSLGFLSMMTSPMATVADMGLLCAIAIVGATAADLIVLPALIATVARWGKGPRGLPDSRD
jgi:predicted RND superfamily exporter protein